MVLSAAPIVVTGAGGFIGAACCGRMQARGQPVRRFVHAQAASDASGDAVAVDLARAPVDRLAHALRGAFAVVHLAGRAHVMNEFAPDSETAYRRANIDATERLALAAVAAGVHRFVFASTVKVNGESTLPGRPFKPGDPAAPHDAYARSKLAGELALAHAASGTAMIATTLRLPLVYGHGARGNFRRLADAVAARRFLPLGAIDNRRSLVAVDNLLDAIDAVLDAPSPVVGAHFVADATAISTPDLVRAIAAALGVAPRLVPVPVTALRVAGALSGRSDTVARLTESLEVDTASLSDATRWRPRPVMIDAASVGAGGAAT